MDLWHTHATAVIIGPHRKFQFRLDSECGRICGDGGVVLLTNDGGGTWTSSGGVSKDPLVSIRFVDDARGWAVGGFPEPSVPSFTPSNVVTETTDGGKT